MKNNKQNWENTSNNAFYEEVKANGLGQLAKKAGLSSGCDIKLLTPYWENAKKILDVGSAYGRVIGALLTMGFKGEITGIERSAAMHKHAQDKFPNVNIIHGDIQSQLPLSNRFDVIFFMWSGLADFPQHQQQTIVNMLANMLSKNGRLIIDTMPMKVQPLDTEAFARQSFRTKAEKSVVQTYEPTDIEIKKYATSSNLKLIELLHCKTDTDRTRWLYVLGQ